MVTRSTPLLRNQAGTNWISTYSGMPELKPIKMQVNILRLSRISFQLRCSSWFKGSFPAREFEVVIHDQRRMVGKARLFVDFYAAGLVGQPGRGDLVINPPPGVIVPGPSTVRPPGVLFFIGGKLINSGWR